MIELLGTWLMAYDPGFNVLRYLSVRTIGGTLTALLLSIFLGPLIIRLLTKMQFSQAIRDDGPESHLAKSGTPTMGGLIIIFSFLISTLLWADFQNPYIWILIFITISFASIGLMDDWLKIRDKSSKGLNGRYKLCLQFIFSLIAMTFMLKVSPEGNNQFFMLPFNKEFIFIYLKSLPDFIYAGTILRNTNFWILPVAVFGKSPNTTCLGTLKRAILALQ
jgi:phospho-N-acetylmuramoyl-pentapeptide-transferase